MTGMIKGFVCEQPFFTKKSAIDHGLECDRQGKGIFLVEIPATITPVFGKSPTRRIGLGNQS